jgi:hypothetical protein
MSSDELQQFLQPTRTRQESNGEAGNADVGTTEDRESSLSENEGKKSTARITWRL